MTTLRCTSSLLAHAGIRRRTLPIVQPTSEDWYANVVLLDGQQCLIAAHLRTLFAVFVPRIDGLDHTRLPTVFVSALHTTLRDEGLPGRAFGDLMPERVQLAASSDRSMQGSMTDLVFLCRWVVSEQGGLSARATAQLRHHLQRNFSPARGHANAVDLVMTSSAVGRAGSLTSPPGGTKFSGLHVRPAGPRLPAARVDHKEDAR